MLSEKTKVSLKFLGAVVTTTALLLAQWYDLRNQVVSSRKDFVALKEEVTDVKDEIRLMKKELEVSIKAVASDSWTRSDMINWTWLLRESNTPNVKVPYLSEIK